MRRRVARGLVQSSLWHAPALSPCAGAFSSSDILPVVQEFENPRHREFNDKNAWSLYNACTEQMKSQSPARMIDGFKALNSVLTAALN